MKQSLVVEIEKMVYGGKGMGRVDGKVVFVPFAAPGERVQAEVVHEKKDYAEAALKKVEMKSPRRVEPFCPLYGDCGGCQYQHFAYEEQLKLKEEAVRETFSRLTRSGSFEFLPIIPSPQDRGYRIRAQFKAGEKGGRRFLGFHAWRTHRVVEVAHCPLLHPLADRILAGLNAYLRKRADVTLKGADLQVSPEEGQGAVVLQTEGSWDPGKVEAMGRGVEGLKAITWGEKKKSVWGDVTLFYDSPEVGGRKLRLQISGDSFVQVNPGQNENLVRKVVDWAGLTGREKVLDLFCGSGNLTLPLALAAKRIWGIDQDRQAIDSARENARENSLSHCSFSAVPAVDGIGRIRGEADSVDLAVLDPPRVGAHGVLEPLAALRPRKILYVSCEPPTLARDLARLGSLGYNVQRIQPLDMFPQTYHIEVIAELEAREKMQGRAYVPAREGAHAGAPLQFRGGEG
jgi:23S rRNA (uracil1939-C5)-methyltransferase